MICAVVLAAGRSRRMGACKVLLPVEGRPVIARLVRALAQCPIQEAIVVTGDNTPLVAKALEGLPAKLVRNPDPDSEMLDSVRLGLRALPEVCAAALIVPGDQTRLNPALVCPLIEAFNTTGRGLVLPTFRGSRGHPLLVSRRYFAEVLHSLDTTGLRGLLQAHLEDVHEVPLDQSAVLDDMDTPEDYRRLSHNADQEPA
jgi:molybdenum cofactor cytidylyltransferase